MSAFGSNRKRSSKHKCRKRWQRDSRLSIESLENRVLLEASARLVSVLPNPEQALQPGEVLDVAPVSLTFRFERGESLELVTDPAMNPDGIDGIRLLRTDPSPAEVPVSLEVGPLEDPAATLRNEVVMRFAEPLTDGTYQIEINEFLVGVNGPFDNDVDTEGNQTFTANFTLDLGTQVNAVVPQPVGRDNDTVVWGAEERGRIEVYFNDTDLDSSLVRDTSLYQLIFTGHESEFDSSYDIANDLNERAIFNPVDVQYDDQGSVPMAVLDFGQPLDQLVAPGQSTAGTYRLRIGTPLTEFLASPTVINPPIDPGSSFSALDEAFALGTLGAQPLVVNEAVSPNTFVLDFPGATSEPGHRDTPSEIQCHTVFGFFNDDPTRPINDDLDSGLCTDRADEFPGILTLNYNFNPQMVGPAGSAFNLITPNQKQRAREIFEIYSNLLGVNFVETASSGFTVGTGDTRIVNAANPTTSLYAFSTFSDFSSGIAVLSNSPIWNDEFMAADNDSGPRSWFQFGMQAIGNLIGLGDSVELPNLTVQGGEFGNPGTAELIFPGAQDVVHGQFVHKPEGHDIDLYKFELDTRGYFTAEIAAERLSDSASAMSSTLDSQLRLFYEAPGGERTLVAQNDDYFSEDSSIGIALDAGTYYIGVSASGNDAYDPTIPFTGIGGTSQGSYQMRLDFRPEPQSFLKDAGDEGPAFDGDHDGKPGGVFDFWFRVASPSEGDTSPPSGPRTIFVDKAASDGGDGTVDQPYRNINDALGLNANGLPLPPTQRTAGMARPGDVVRVIANGLEDGDQTNDLAYEIGVGFFDQPLQDGAKIEVPKGVTLVLDAGTKIKSRRGAIYVGSISVGVDKAGGALQVLGTAEHPVVMTSVNDELGVGNGADPQGRPPTPGDWGGLLFNRQVDDPAGRFDYERQGIFLDSVFNADMRYAGGTVIINAQPQQVNPIDIRDARPGIYFNTIMASDLHAISATPDSFEETNFHAPEFQRTVMFTSDISRVGPDIYGNRFTGIESTAGIPLQNNTFSGLFIRAETPAGGELQKLTVAGRFDDTDIVHILSEALILQGTPGGALENVARTDASLVVDPNLIVKLDSSRIETEIGAQLLAEGSLGNQVIFTSLNDDLFGSGGVFDSGNDGESFGAEGDWGGIYFGHSSRGSLDHALITYAGGTSEIEGTFSGFNAVEVHQARVRISNSEFISNASGVGGQGPVRREGRGDNSEAAIFVRGAQPIMVNNQIRGTSSGSTMFPAAAITIDANSLNHYLVEDWGRSVGDADLFVDSSFNQGAFVRGNRIENNDVNGLLVRGATLATQVVFDDTDIVHVVTDEIVVPNFHTYGGLRLESSALESLVVKLGGTMAGLTASGTPLDIDDRISGAVQIIGQPQRPVILTSLGDNTVGAGRRLDGTLQTSTVASTLPGSTNPGAFSITFNASDDITNRSAVLNTLQQAADLWETVIEDDVTVAFDVDFGDLDDPVLGQAGPDSVTVDFDTVRDRLITDVAGRPHESIVTQLPTFAELQVQFPDTSFFATESLSIGYPQAKALGFTEDDLIGPITSAIDPTATRDGTVTIDSQFDTDNPAVDTLLPVMVHELGHALGFLSSADDEAIEMGTGGGITLQVLDLFRLSPGAGQLDFTNSPRIFDPTIEHVFYDGGEFDPARTAITIPGLQRGDIPLSRGESSIDGYQASHWRDEDGVGMNGTIVGIMDPELDPGGEITSNDLRAFDLIGWDVVYGGSAEPGAWRSIMLDEFSHDRNVDVITEAEPLAAIFEGANETPAEAQFLGQLAPNEKSGDDILRLGFEVHGFINEPTDVDIYSFDAVAGTEVWIDVDRTDPNLDSVIELVNTDGEVLIFSNDSINEATLTFPQVGGLPPVTPTRRPMTKSLFVDQDHFSINTMDAGMRVVLHGVPGETNTYFVKVRSNGPSVDDLGTIDPIQGVVNTDIPDGLSSGVYQLQVRLQELDEIPGSVVKFADIRFATTGIEILGQPGHSPLLGEHADVEQPSESGQNDIFADAQPVGNPFAADRAAIGIAGALADDSDIDWYRFDPEWQDVEAGVPAIASLTFDLDYAAGTANPNTFLAIFDNAGNLLHIGTRSNIDDDLPAPLEGPDVDDLSRGSFDNADPFIGPVFLDLNAGPFFIAVTSDLLRPEELTLQIQQPDAANPLVRIYPNDAITRIADERFDGATAADWADFHIPSEPPQQIPFLQNGAVPYHLNDMVLYFTTGSDLQAVNPFTGASITSSPMPLRDALTGVNPDWTVGDLALGLDGGLYSLSLGFNDATSGNLLQIDPATGVILNDAPDDEIVTFEDDGSGTGMAVQTDDGVLFTAMTFSADGNIYAIGHRGLSTALGGPGVLGAAFDSNILYAIDPDTGLAQSAAFPLRTDTTMVDAYTDIIERGQVNTVSSGSGNNVLDTANANGITLNDGNSFVVAPGSVTFEMDLGVVTDLDVRGLNATGLTEFVTDGTFFTLDGNGYEFDTGPVLAIRADFNGIVDETEITIDGVVFTLDTNDSTTAARPIRLVSGDNAAAIRAKIVTAINNEFQDNRAEAGPLSARITFNDDSSVASSEDDASVDVVGALGVSLGGNAIEVEETFDAAQVVAAIRAAGLNAGFDGTSRVNFPQASTGDFDTMDLDSPDPGLGSGVDRAPFMTRVADSPGITGNVEIDYLLNDSSGDIATRVETAINARFGAATASLVSATDVLLATSRSFTTADAPFRLAGFSGGGLVTGLAEVQGTLFAVTDAGGMFAVDRGTGLPTQIPLPTAGVSFSGLTAGPADLSPPLFQDVLFASSSGGRLYAFNTQGVLRPVFANGASDIAMPPNAQGLTFSVVQQNPWSLATATDQRIFEPGHGQQQWVDGASSPGGNASFYFGQRNTQGTLDYNFTGGAQGVLLSESFDLSDYSAADEPHLYVTYFLDSENEAENTPDSDSDLVPFRDAFNVYVTDDDPTTAIELGQWQLLTTNNSNLVNFRVEDLDDPGFKELFDSTGAWRQTRLNLSEYAGSSNLRLRFEFNTAGSFDYGNSGQGGVELRGVAATSINDGQQFDVGGQLFEFDFDGGATAPNPIPITVTDDAVTVASKVKTALLAALTPRAVGFPELEAHFFPQFANQIRIIGFPVIDAGPLGLTDSLEPDARGAFDRVCGPTDLDCEGQIGWLRALNNANEGLYIDDVIVGFAERGEKVVNHSGTTFVPNPEVADNEVLVGNYDLEIRRASELRTSTLLSNAPPQRVQPASHAFDTNDRHADFFQITVTSLPIEGEEIILSDGIDEVTLVLSTTPMAPNGSVVTVTYSLDSSLAEVADQIVASINSLYVQDVLNVDVTAASLSTSNIIRLFGEPTLPTADVSFQVTPDQKAALRGVTGDDNRFRDQGQLLIHSNRISDSAEYGVLIDAGPRDNANSPRQGPPRHLREENIERLAPGATVFNNLIVDSGRGAIRFGGDNLVDPEGAVPFGRILNNTLVGALGAPQGAGVELVGAASPTLLNNIFSNFMIAVDQNGLQFGNPVIGGSVFNGNANNGELGESPILLSMGDPLFVNPVTGNFLLAPFSRAIDSSVDSVEDRPSLVTVRDPLGIGLSPILAPSRDGLGQLRIDDEDVDAFPGLGADVFKDRGAFERADQIGPVARLLNPADQSAIDSNPEVSTVQVDGTTLLDFQILLSDLDVSGNDLQGTGIDDFSVGPSDLQVSRNDTALVEGIDYAFAFDAVNDIITLSPLTGAWSFGAYRIVLSDMFDREGNPLRQTPAGQATGETVLLVNLDVGNSDFGDAPLFDPITGDSITTGEAAARHPMVEGFSLGAGITVEPDGQPSINADLDPRDDGVVFDQASLQIRGQGTVTVTLNDVNGLGGLLDAWIDFSGDGALSPDEQIIFGGTLQPGDTEFSFDVTEGATTDLTYARFRLSSTGGLMPGGAALDGEVEDYAIQLIDPGIDFGDAPSPFPTLLPDGARHAILPGFYLGSTVDAEADGQPTPNADGDQPDEDGVVLPGSLAPGNTSEVTVIASAAGLLNAWIDFNGNGDWSDTGEQIAIDEALVAGSNTLNVPVPAEATETDVFARFRFSSEAGLGFEGLASDGEVEDYLVTISSASWHNADNPLDVDGDGISNQIDALTVINELDLRRDSDPNTGQLNTPANPPPFYDVNDDGFVTPIDALLIINELPSSGSSAAVQAPSPVGISARGADEFAQAFDVGERDLDEAFAEWGRV